jgi:hypothetical protein
MFWRRLRGLVVTTIGGAFVGGVTGTVLALIGILTPGQTKPLPEWLGVIFVLAAFGALFGALGGAAFAMLLMVAERGRRVAELRPWRVGLWAAIASAVAVRLTFSLWTVVALGSAVGAVVAAAATFIANRAPDRPMPEREVSSPPA